MPISDWRRQGRIVGRGKRAAKMGLRESNRQDDAGWSTGWKKHGAQNQRVDLVTQQLELIGFMWFDLTVELRQHRPGAGIRGNLPDSQTRGQAGRSTSEAIWD